MAVISEEKLSYKGSAFGRLLGYVKPYASTMVLCTVLMLVVTALNLYRPILIGRAIDDYIEGYARPYACVDASEAQVTFDGLTLSREYGDEADAFAVTVYAGDKYYLIRGLDRAGMEALLQKKSGRAMRGGDALYSGFRNRDRGGT